MHMKKCVFLGEILGVFVFIRFLSPYDLCDKNR